MAEAMRLRGPDDKGVWLSDDRRLALSHRRLSILDVSSRGHQPMLSPDGRSVIVYNGEIYNFREIRSDLRRKETVSSRNGHGVILAAYRRYGSDCLSRFNGMFAFAIWDADRQSLFLARDRFGGQAPAVLLARRLFLCASEMKGLAAYDGPMKLTLNSAVHRYLYLTYRVSPDTVYSEVRQLDSGHYYCWRMGNSVRAVVRPCPEVSRKLVSFPESESFCGKPWRAR
jgi:asparagine synthase (glutamine-hydrolysing)